jgi:hypothetical protein
MKNEETDWKKKKLWESLKPISQQDYAAQIQYKMIMSQIHKLGNSLQMLVIA